jgi:hypothetical protein
LNRAAPRNPEATESIGSVDALSLSRSKEMIHHHRYQRPATTWHDYDINLPLHATGTARTTCPRCSASRHKDRDPCLSVDIDRGLWCCHHCGWVGNLRGPHHQQDVAVVSRPPVQPVARKRAALRRVWGEAYPLAADDPVLAYLHHRGITLSLSDLPHALRYHPHLLYKHENGQRTFHAGMLARVDSPAGRPVSIHRTYLTPDGHKANVSSPKKLMAAPVPGSTRGAAIRLYLAGATLAVAEGIETALAIRIATGLPVWATISAGGMARLIVPPEVSLMVICADHDPAGLDAARALARRLLKEQRRVKVLIPSRPGADWADDLQEMAHG